jgi:hypothetical protein
MRLAPVGVTSSPVTPFGPGVVIMSCRRYNVAGAGTGNNPKRIFMLIGEAEGCGAKSTLK